MWKEVKMLFSIRNITFRMRFRMMVSSSLSTLWESKEVQLPRVQADSDQMMSLSTRMTKKDPSNSKVNIIFQKKITLNLMEMGSKLKKMKITPT